MKGSGSRKMRKSKTKSYMVNNTKRDSEEIELNRKSSNDNNFDPNNFISIEDSKENLDIKFNKVKMIGFSGELEILNLDYDNEKMEDDSFEEYLVDEEISNILTKKNKPEAKNSPLRRSSTIIPKKIKKLVKKKKEGPKKKSLKPKTNKNKENLKANTLETPNLSFDERTKDLQAVLSPRIRNNTIHSLWENLNENDSTSSNMDDPKKKRERERYRSMTLENLRLNVDIEKKINKKINSKRSNSKKVKGSKEKEKENGNGKMNGKINKEERYRSMTLENLRLNVDIEKKINKKINSKRSNSKKVKGSKEKEKENGNGKMNGKINKEDLRINLDILNIRSSNGKEQRNLDKEKNKEKNIEENIEKDSKEDNQITNKNGDHHHSSHSTNNIKDKSDEQLDMNNIKGSNEDSPNISSSLDNNSSKKKEKVKFKITSKEKEKEGTPVEKRKHIFRMTQLSQKIINLHSSAPLMRLKMQDIKQIKQNESKRLHHIQLIADSHKKYLSSLNQIIQAYIIPFRNFKLAENKDPKKNEEAKENHKNIRKMFILLERFSNLHTNIQEELQYFIIKKKNNFKTPIGHLLHNKIQMFEFYKDYYLLRMKTNSLLLNSKSKGKGLDNFLFTNHKNNSFETSISDQFSLPLSFFSELKGALQNVLAHTNDEDPDKAFLEKFLQETDPYSHFSNISSFSILQGIEKKIEKAMPVKLAFDYRMLVEMGSLFVPLNSNSPIVPLTNHLNEESPTKFKKSQKGYTVSRSSSINGITVKRIKVECFLFNDIFVYYKEERKSASNVQIIHLKDVLSCDSTSNESFELKYQANKVEDISLKFFSMTEQQNSLWVKSFQTAVERYKINRVFGIPLSEVLENEKKKEKHFPNNNNNNNSSGSTNGSNNEIPLVIEKCLQVLSDEESLSEEGIFRQSVGKDQLKEYLEMIERNGVSLAELQVESPHLVTSIIRTFLRHLPDSLIPLTQQANWINLATKIQNNQNSNPEKIINLDSFVVLIN
eukprot:TRINITY_DN4423_c0_g1_i1.p1 TRINITY_DN4423_c0_g1~~TRINITY_DN4423_c0_g1_i1.p1  ORF type:complete len:998 (-),score=375.32 TRINITY_DN4423_c0_g1_i1:11-3004(-)